VHNFGSVNADETRRQDTSHDLMTPLCTFAET
jgi:hypothetical protein